MDRRKLLLVVAVVVAALGAGLVFLYAQSAEDRAAEQFRTIDVLKVVQPIAPGESATDAASAGKILTEAVPEGEVLPGATNDGTVFAGSVALTTLYPGEQMVPEKFGAADQVEGQITLPTPEGMVAIGVNLTDTGRVGAFTRPGSRVAIVLTGELPGSNGTASRTLLTDVLVLGVGDQTQLVPQVDESGQPTTTGTPATQLTIAATQRQALSVRTAESLGELSLQLLTGESRVVDGEQIDTSQLFAGGS